MLHASPEVLLDSQCQISAEFTVATALWGERCHKIALQFEVFALCQFKE